MSLIWNFHERHLSRKRTALSVYLYFRPLRPVKQQYTTNSVLSHPEFSKSFDLNANFWEESHEGLWVYLFY